MEYDLVLQVCLALAKFVSVPPNHVLVIVAGYEASFIQSVSTLNLVGLVP
jgi:hypothetical protein